MSATPTFEEIANLHNNVGHMCPYWMSDAIRHVARNCDISCIEHDNCDETAGKYDGWALATVFNTVPQLLAEIERLKQVEKQMDELLQTLRTQ